MVPAPFTSKTKSSASGGLLMKKHLEAKRGRLLILSVLSIAAFALTCPSPAQAQEDALVHQTGAAENGWVELIGDNGAVGISNIKQGVTQCGGVSVADGSHVLTVNDGNGVLAAPKRVKNGNVFSKQAFGDCEVQLEFLIGKGSNSGIKLQGLYEVQLYDSHGKENPGGADCGGIYPHWEFKTQYWIKKLTYTDKGYPPLVNAAKPAGEWQTLKIIFKAPRFNDSGKKTANARFDLVELNGVAVQKDVELDSATGNTKPPRPEKALAPLMLQMDHGAIAFRNARVLPLGKTVSGTDKK